MKKTAIILLLSIGLANQAVNAKPAEAQLNWSGVMPGSIMGTDVALTGAGGGELAEGELIIKETGAFTTKNAILVEAHGVGSGSTVSKELYDGYVAWGISSATIDHPAYEATDLSFQMNGKPIEVNGETVETDAGHHKVGISLSMDTPSNKSKVTPGDNVGVSVHVYAESPAGVPKD